MIGHDQGLYIIVRPMPVFKITDQWKIGFTSKLDIEEYTLSRDSKKLNIFPNNKLVAVSENSFLIIDEENGMIELKYPITGYNIIEMGSLKGTTNNTVYFITSFSGDLKIIKFTYDISSIMTIYNTQLPTADFVFNIDGRDLLIAAYEVQDYSMVRNNLVFDHKYYLLL